MVVGYGGYADKHIAVIYFPHHGFVHFTGAVGVVYGYACRRGYLKLPGHQHLGLVAAPAPVLGRPPRRWPEGRYV